MAVLQGRTGISGAHLQKISQLQADARIPIRVALRWLDTAVQATRDPSVGLRAAYLAKRGNYDVIEYAAASASTWGEALQIILQYIRLVNDAADFSLRVRDGRARMEFGSKVPLNRAAADFQLGCVATAACRWLGSLRSFALEFTYAQPRDLSAHRELFGPVALSFSAQADAVSFDAKLLDAPVSAADPRLNAILRRHADRLVSALPNPEQLGSMVRALLTSLLIEGEANGDQVAARFGMSRRTLCRRLEREGTSYKDLLDQVRRDVALRELTAPSRSIQEISHLLGYSDSTAFSRAFRRWTGQSPADYRKSTSGAGRSDA